MTQIASSETIRAAFHNVSVTDVHGRPMQLTRNGEQFFAEFDDPDLDARTTTAQRITREVVMVTGSHNQQIYWYATGRSRLLGQLPGAYLIDEQRWIPRRAPTHLPPASCKWLRRYRNCPLSPTRACRSPPMNVLGHFRSHARGLQLRIDWPGSGVASRWSKRSAPTWKRRGPAAP